MNSINRSYQFIALSLAILMFFTSVSFTVDMHFCKNELKSINLFGKAKSCHEVSKDFAESTCSHHQKMMEKNESLSLEKKDCCENKTFHIQVDEDRPFQTNDFSETLPLQHALIAQVFKNFKYRAIEINTHDDVHYRPPFIQRDIPILVQSFLL